MVIPLDIANKVKSPFTNKELKKHERKAREHVANLSRNGVTAGSIAINNRCNLSCTHCYILEPERTDGELSTNYRAISQKSFNKETAREIAQDFKNAGTLLLTIPTMEPLLTEESRSGSLAVAQTFVPDEDIARGKTRGMSIITNATLTHKLSNHQISELEKRVEFLSVSLEGGKTVHDQIRGEGNFDKTAEGIKDLVRRGYSADRICLQSTIQPSVSDAYGQAFEVLEATDWIGTGKTSFTAFINPKLTFTPDKEDVEYHLRVFQEILRACSDAERKGIRDRMATIYGTYESPAAVVALNKLIKDSGARQEDLEFNAFETSYYLRHPSFEKLDVRIEVAPHPVEIPSYPRVAASRDLEKKINLTDFTQYPQGARMTSCFAYQTDEVPWAHWMPGLIPYLDKGLQERGAKLASSLELPNQEEVLSVDPNKDRTREEYFEEVLSTGVKIQLRKTTFLSAIYSSLY